MTHSPAPVAIIRQHYLGVHDEIRRIFDFASYCLFIFRGDRASRTLDCQKYYVHVRSRALPWDDSWGSYDQRPIVARVGTEWTRHTRRAKKTFPVRIVNVTETSHDTRINSRCNKRIAMRESTMKFIVFLFAFVTTSLSFAMVNPFGHWTLKNLTCASGAVPNPGLPATVRVDFHLYDDTKFEQIMLRADSWIVARGTYTNTDKQICFSTTEIFMAKQPPFTQPGRPICWDFRLKAQELSVQLPSASDCPPGDVLSWNFVLMEPL